MKTFIAACAACLFAIDASATMLQIETVNTVAADPSQWNLPTPLPTNISVSFWLDSLSADTSAFDTIQSSGSSCLGHFDSSGLNVSNFVVKADGVALWTADSLDLRARGVNAGGKCPGGFFGSVATTDGARSLSAAWDFGGISESALLAGNDPLANLLLNIAAFSGVVSFDGEWGYLATTTATTTIRDVPEPASLALMSLGLLGLLFATRRRMNAAQDNGTR